jgi:hypothetical protein
MLVVKSQLTIIPFLLYMAEVGAPDLRQMVRSYKHSMESVWPGRLHRAVGALFPFVIGGGVGTPLPFGKQEVRTYSPLYREYVDPWSKAIPMSSRGRYLRW